jgi:hypothetical protein
MPEAAVYENNFAAERECKIGAARQILPMKAEAKSHRMQRSANNNFRSRVFAPNGLHDATP